MICEVVKRKGTSVCVCVHGSAFNCCCIIVKHCMYSDYNLICLEQNMYNFYLKFICNFIKKWDEWGCLYLVWCKDKLLALFNTVMKLQVP
jgi:hypothetical protein